MANIPPGDWIQLEYTGTRTGKMYVSIEGMNYGYSALRPHFWVNPNHLAYVMRNGTFREVPKPSVPPIAETFSKEALEVVTPAKVAEVFVPEQMANDAKSARKPRGSK